MCNISFYEKNKTFYCGTRQRSWLRPYATSWKVAGSIPDEIIGFFSIDIILATALGPGVDSASNRNEYQESSWG
jgi:hypothetical protein